MDLEAFGWRVHEANDLRIPRGTKEDPKGPECDPYTKLHRLTYGHRPTDRTHRDDDHEVCIFLHADATTIRSNIPACYLDRRSTGRLLARNATYWSKIRKQSLFRQPKTEIVDPCGFRRRLKRSGDSRQRNFDVRVTQTLPR